MAFGIDDAVAAGLNIINKFIPDPEAKAKAQQEYLQMQSDERMKLLGARSDILKAEVASGGLAAQWRPILMLTFGALIVARMFGYTAPNVSPAEYIELWAIVKLGIGGYIGGRTAEKLVPSIAAAIKG